VQGINESIQQTQQTPHFRIHYTAGSFAGQHLALVSERLEHAYRILADVLGVDEAHASIIDVYLSEMLAGPQMLGSGGYAKALAREIHEVYRADAPGHGLERSLLQVLLALAFGNEQALPPLIMEGVLAYVTQRLDNSAPEEQVLKALATAKAQRTLPSLVSLLSGATLEPQDINGPASASFVAFLIRTYGEHRFQLFVRRLQAGTAEEATRAAYQRTLRQLEQAWYKTLKVAPTGGILRFLRLIVPYLRPYWLQVIEVMFYLACSVAFSIGLAETQGLLLDRALPRPGSPGDLHALAVIMGAVIAAFILISLISLRKSYVSAYVSESVLRQMRLRIFSLIQHLHPAFFQTIQTGDILSRMTNDLDEVEYALGTVLTQGILMILTLVSALATIFLSNWRLAIIALVATPLFFLTGRFLGPVTARASLERQQHLAAATSTLQENLGAQALVKAFGLQQQMISDYADSLNTLLRSSIRLTFLSGVYGLSISTIAYAIQLTVIGVGSYLVIGKALTVGTLFAFLALLGLVIGPMQGISSVIQALQQASGSMERVDELLKAHPAIEDRPNAQRLLRLAQAIQFAHLFFGYSDGQPTLRNLDMSIAAGTNVALVGPSGSGKSTILNLILRFYDPQQGHVIFDGVDLREAALESVRGQMGIVFQDNVLFNSSIRENIRLGKLDATDAQVEEAAKAAEIHDFILSMPEGYDTVVGERGSRLSGGQRQRLAIARAILRNPAILLLDEATSALDPHTEAAINATLGRLARGRTTISVTHRLSSVVHTDRIYVLDRGELLEQGTHAELLQRGGLYAQLWREQSGGASVKAQDAGVDVSRLQRIPLFAELEPDLLATAAKRLATERYAAGEVIITQGDIGDKLYLIVRGQVDVLATDAGGRQRLMAVLWSGDHFGEMALMWDMPRTATVRARSAVELYSLNKEDFNTLLSTVPGLRDRLEQMVIKRSQLTTHSETQIREKA